MTEFSQPGKIMVIIGLLIAGFGLLILTGGEIPCPGRPPGDLFINGKHFSIYIPLATCLVVSIIITLIFFLFRDR
jgi:hypothetical protein